MPSLLKLLVPENYGGDQFPRATPPLLANQIGQGNIYGFAGAEYPHTTLLL